MSSLKPTIISAKRRSFEGYLFFLAFVLTIPMANWFIGNIGTVCLQNGPCLIPVAPTLMAPSGVLMIGLALVLRDLVQRRLGARFSIIAIIAGAGLSIFLAPPNLVLASGLSFLISELADFLVYTPLQKRRLVLAVFASGLVGLTIDSIIFLYLAFGNLYFVTGQIVGKSLMIIIALPAIIWIRQRDEKLGILPA